MTAPRSVRFDLVVNNRLTRYVSAHPGASGSSVANRLVDEGLRMDEHPMIVFRDGATGRRAVVIGGADVREIIRAVRDVREAESASESVVEIVAKNSGQTTHQVLAAIDYWAAYPHEIDAWLAEADTLEAEMMGAAARKHDLLSS